ncbi:TonB-dependent receptor [Pelomonas sp. HMWF004]|nr:TonB-dependent receptor [Pelomonas sp. HMWF004]
MRTPSTTSVFLRGADSRHTLVLVDGVRMDSQSTGGATWQGIPIAQIERIEVLKGPASAIYGSDAVGGVVQIFTRKAGGKTSADLGVAVGNLGVRKLDGGVFGSVGIVDYALTVAAERAAGFNATTTANTFGFVPDRDDWRKSQGTARLGAQLAAGQRVEAVLLRSHANAGYDADKASPLVDDRTTQDTDAARLAWTSQWAPALQTQVSYGESRDRYKTEPSPYLTITHVKNLAVNGSYLLGAGQQVNFLAERIEDELKNSGLLTTGVGKRHRNAVGAGYLFSQGRFSFQAHARHDDDSQFGSADTGTLLAGFQVTPGLRAVASAGNSFRAPTLYQQGTIYGPDLGKGADPLKPERGHNVEIGLKYASGDTEASATVYRNRIIDLINFEGALTTCNSGFGCYGNVPNALLQGLSLAGSTRVAMFHISATLDLQAPKDVTPAEKAAALKRPNNYGKLLARRAQRLGTVNADADFGDWVLGAGIQASSARFDNASNARRLGGYGLLNLNAQYKLSRELKLQFNLDNAFDKDYGTAYGYAAAPRTVLVSLRWSPQL